MSTSYLHKKDSQGFTIIELLVVIAIIGLLSSVVLAALGGSRNKSRDLRRIQDMNQVQKALEHYYDDYGHYPRTAASGATLVLRSLCTNHNSGNPAPATGAEVIVDVVDGTALVPNYLPVYPTEPNTNGTNNHCYVYISNGIGKDYKFIDYRIFSSNVDAYPAYIDPRRNITSTVCQVPGGGTTPVIAAPTWAVYSSGAATCW